VSPCTAPAARSHKRACWATAEALRCPYYV
jgi:hypothetical protein